VADREAGLQIYGFLPTGIKENGHLSHNRIKLLKNPANGQIELILTSFSPQNLNLILFNVLSQKVRFYNLGKISGNQRISLPAEGLPTGVYFLKIENSHFRPLKIVILQPN